METIYNADNSKQAQTLLVAPHQVSCTSDLNVSMGTLISKCTLLSTMAFADKTQLQSIASFAPVLCESLTGKMINENGRRYSGNLLESFTAACVSGALVSVSFRFGGLGTNVETPVDTSCELRQIDIATTSSVTAFSVGAALAVTEMVTSLSPVVVVSPPRFTASLSGLPFVCFF